MSLWVRFPAQRIVKEKTVKPEFSCVAFKSNNHQAGVSFLNFHGPRSCQQSGDIFLGSTPNAGTVKEKTVKPRHLFTLPHSHLFQVSYMSVPLVGQQTFRPCGSNPFSVWSGGLRVTGRKTTYCDTGSIPVSGTWRVRSSRQPYILCLVQTPYCASHRRI